MKLVTNNMLRWLGIFFGLFSISNICRAGNLDPNQTIRDLHDMTDVNNNLAYYNSALNSYAQSAISAKNNK